MSFALRKPLNIYDPGVKVHTATGGVTKGIQGTAQDMSER